MKTIQTSAGQIELQEIIGALSQLKVPDLESVTKKLLAVLDMKKSPGQRNREEELVGRIRYGGPTEEQRLRQRILLAKLVRGTLSDEENKEALNLLPVFEEWDHEQMLLLIELSEIRGCSLEEVMQNLNIAPPADVVA